jgi:ATP-dependent DNA helicase UvrD/PcrA
MTRPLAQVRARAREERKRFNASSDLLSQLQSWLFDQHGIELVPVDKDGFLQGSRGEIAPAEGCLYYDRHLDKDPAERLEVVAHEYGHLVLHHSQFTGAAQDLIRGSVFLNTGAPALSRYSPKSQQEAEASAFAAEFICPAREIFDAWEKEKEPSLVDLAGQFGATPFLALLQLAEGLYETLVGPQALATASSDFIVNAEQEKAATRCGFPVIVDAGPGTGKTKTLVRRIVYLIREKGVLPEKILALTFSNEAAVELQDRVHRALGADLASRVLISTFHGFGVVFLNTLGHHAGLDVDFSILDEITQEELISELLGTVDCEALLNVKDPNQTAAEATRYINFLKDRLVGPLELRAAINSWSPSPEEQEVKNRSYALLRLLEKYEEVKAQRHQADFADLIRIPHELLAQNQELRQQIRNDFSWVLVDEYQDVSRATALFLRQLCGEHNPPWVVGDARQAIYRFRGAEPENVKKFGEDFSGSQYFQLAQNYRSSGEIVAVLNRLAAWLDDPTHSGSPPERWKANASIASLGKTPVLMAIANSDAAERKGVIAAVEEWLAAGIPAQEIAVLARRNVDVRNLAIELKKKGIRAVTSGLLTAEGAGGDISGVLTVVDHLQAVPRLVYCLYRDRTSSDMLNAVIAQLLKSDIDGATTPQWTGSVEEQQLAAKIYSIVRKLRQLLHSGDGWLVACEFLFFLTPYVKQLLVNKENAESAVQLEEVLSALALAANYRLSHPHVRPRTARLGLAERMRHLATQGTPGLVAPRKQMGAVRVMTCHASKGLEFPVVAVAGQSLPDIPPAKPWLPPALRPRSNDDLLQAESLLFVGISRGQRAAVVSYASSASGRPRSKARRFPDLLIRLRGSGVTPVIEWPSFVSGDEEIELGRVWGGQAPDEVSTYSLDPRTCRVRTYLEEHLGTRFRGRMRPLYPEFMLRIRRTLRRIVERAVEAGRPLTGAEAIQIAEEEWPADHYSDHAHLSLYRPRTLRWAALFAESFNPKLFLGAKLKEEVVEWEDPNGCARTIKLQLIGQFQESNGDHLAIALRVGSADEGAAEVKWSELKEYERLPFVLLQKKHGRIQPWVFFGEGGQLQPFRWSRRKPAETLDAEASNARSIFDQITAGKFIGTANEWSCDRCACRTVCPIWMGAAPKATT